MSEFDPSIRNALLIAGASAAFIVAGCSKKAEIPQDTDRFVAPGDCASKIIYGFSMEKGDYANILGVENKSGEKNAVSLGYDDFPVKNPYDAPDSGPMEEGEANSEEQTETAVDVAVFAGKLANPKAWSEDLVDDYFEPVFGHASSEIESGGSYALDLDQIDENTIGVEAVICGSPDKEKLDKIKEEERKELLNTPINPGPPVVNDPR